VTRNRIRVKRKKPIVRRTLSSSDEVEEGKRCSGPLSQEERRSTKRVQLTGGGRRKEERADATAGCTTMSRSGAFPKYLQEKMNFLQRREKGRASLSGTI